MNLLFICSRNRKRSPTAEGIFGVMPGVQALSAGTSPDAETPVSADLLEWADVILAMEAIHRRRLLQRFPRQIKAKRVVVLGVPDNYEYMDDELVARLQKVVADRVRLPSDSDASLSTRLDEGPPFRL